MRHREGSFVEGHIGKVRYRLERDDGLYRAVGFAIFTRSGCLGSTYQEPGRDMFRDFNLSIYKWTWTLGFWWKDMSNER